MLRRTCTAFAIVVVVALALGPWASPALAAPAGSGALPTTWWPGGFLAQLWGWLQDLRAERAFGLRAARPAQAAGHSMIDPDGLQAGQPSQAAGHSMIDPNGARATRPARAVAGAEERLPPGGA